MVVTVFLSARQRQSVVKWSKREGDLSRVSAAECMCPLHSTFAHLRNSTYPVSRYLAQGQFRRKAFINTSNISGKFLKESSVVNIVMRSKLMLHRYLR